MINDVFLCKIVHCVMWWCLPWLSNETTRNGSHDN